jgi:8-oxo-dGTP pyrophosphatase MutT (NUDIX family)
MNNIEGTNKITCNNCGKEGHAFYQCKLPIISCGIIVFRKKNDNLEYLMNRRRHSYGFIDMIRGKYNSYDYEQINSLINQMSSNEKEHLKTRDFTSLWDEMWGNDIIYQQHNEYNISLKKFNQLKKTGIVVENGVLSLNELIDQAITDWDETEWEFPKGRRNSVKEKDLDCALREFEEETGINRENVNVIENLITLEESFIGTNFKCYKHKYFVASSNNDNVSLDNFQISEVSKLDWKSLEKCLEIIRPDNLEKKELITNINNVLQQFRLYS